MSAALEQVPPPHWVVAREQLLAARTAVDVMLEHTVTRVEAKQ